MPLKQQVISLDLAKELAEVMKEKGITPLKSLFKWSEDMNKKAYIKFSPNGVFRVYTPAYTVAELGKMLPAYLDNGNSVWSSKPFGQKFRTGYSGYSGVKTFIQFEIADTEADSRCKMLIHLLKNNLITL